MPNFSRLLKKNTIKERAKDLVCQPIIFDLKNLSDQKKVEQLLKSRAIIDVVDEYAEQLRELAIVKNPRLLQIQPSHSHGHSNLGIGRWIFYPWRKTLVHVLEKNEFKKLRTSRNFNLILPSEQKKYEKTRIGIAGLNVGNPAALCMALEGVEEMKLADFDPLSVSNLNRFRSSVIDLGVNKAILSARQAYEINPYAKIKVFPKGITPDNIQDFLLKPRLDVLVEEMDSLGLKIKIRELACQNRIPVVMVTGNGENVILDVERFDLNPKLPLMSGYLKQSVIKGILSADPKTMLFKTKLMLARDFMGTKYLTERLQDSFKLVGVKLAGIPQISESSFLRGATVAYAIRQIVTDKKVKSGRYNLRLDQLLTK